jgi:hypothetical protein
MSVEAESKRTRSRRQHNTNGQRSSLSLSSSSSSSSSYPSSSSSSYPSVTLLVNDCSASFPEAGKSFTVGHNSFTEPFSIFENLERTITTLKQGKHSLRVDTRTGGVSFEYQRQCFRHIYRESFGLLEDSSAFDDEVWAECKGWLDEAVLARLGLPQSRSGWVSFFDALPWRACACHVQVLKGVYV